MLGLSLLCALVAADAQVAASTQAKPLTRDRMVQWVETSREGRRYDIALSLPKAPPPPGGYPAIFVLDGDTAFSTVADAARNQEILFGPITVIGVSNAGAESGAADGAARRRDMSLIEDLSDARSARASLVRNAGSDDFATFLLGQLKASVASQTPIDPARAALFGHSLGGLLALHILLTRPGSYDMIAAGSPSIWAGGGLIRRELRSFEQTRGARPPAVLITVGALENRLQPEDTRAAAAMRMAMTQRMISDYAMVRDAQDVAHRLRKDGFDLTFRAFPDATHSSVIPAYLGAGVRLAMQRWYPARSR